MKNIRVFLFALLFIYILLPVNSAQAVINPTGTIFLDSSCATNVSCAQIMQDSSEINFGCTNCNVLISASGLTGYAWGENIGWVNLDPSSGGVTNDGAGNLGGYAWGENAGWINFGPFSNSATAPVKIVQVGDHGEFTGFAWSENYGWIKFDCGTAGACVKTNYFTAGAGAGLPVIVTKAATNIGQTDATLNGTWDGNGMSMTTWFEWGTTPALGNISGSINQGMGNGPMSFNLSGLTPNTTYYFRAAGQNSSSILSMGSIFTFQTGGPGGGGPGGGPVPPTDGACGSSNGGIFATAPVNNYCSAGSFSGLSGSGLWAWTCAGLNGGSSASCSAERSALPPKVAPVVFLSVDPKVSSAGLTSTLTWWADNVDYSTCIATNDSNDPSWMWSDPSYQATSAAPGTQTVSPNFTTTYTLECIGDSDGKTKATASATLTIVAFPPPGFCEKNPNDPFCTLPPPDVGCFGDNCASLPPPDTGCFGSDCGTPTPPGGLLDGFEPPTPPEIINKIRETIEGPGGTVAKTLAVFGLIAGLAAYIGAALFANPLSLSELIFIPFRLWSLLLSALGLKKRVRPWGTVYDDVTKQPLDPAYVVLSDLSGKEINSSITDLDGRYGFLVEPGVYKLAANKTDYSFPGKKLLGRTRDELYGDLYFGEEIVVKESGEVIAKNIPMDPIKFNWNEFAKNQQKLTRFYKRRDFIFSRITAFFFAIGFIFALLALIAAPAPYNLIIFSIYVLMIILRTTGVLKPKTKGALIDSATGSPLAFAIIKVFSVANPGVVIIQKVADALGRYYCLVPNNHYFVKISRKNQDESYTDTFTSGPFEVKRGIINKEFQV